MASKFHNVRTLGYASKKEARRAQELKLLQRAGEISGLTEQVRYELIPQQRMEINGVIVKEGSAAYFADFVYQDKNGLTHVEDTKGMLTPLYRLKRKLMLQVHGIKIEEL